jgi:2-methylisocitrate lyase-like PEP mutase family enzyme
VNTNVPDAFSTFRALHAGDRLLVLANAWDAASAALFAAAGAKAVATSSAGLAWSCGYADGNALPPPSLLSAVGSICAVVTDIPVTVDVEGGYSDEPDEVANLVAQLYRIGVAGINIEDGNGTPHLLVTKIAAVKQRIANAGGDIFINARTDVFLRELAPDEGAVRETISRAMRYARAGADGIFVPELKDRDAIRSVAGAVELPLNLMAVPGLPPARELHALGVRRLSAGASLAKLAYGASLEAAEAFLGDGDSQVLFSKRSLDYGEANALLRREA